MKVMILTGSPNCDGLTASCGEAAKAGVLEAGGEADIVSLNKLTLGSCHACGNGWGPCRDEHECQINDDFQKLHGEIKDADAFVIVTPVYWGDMSESTKSFLDRIRRCEAWKKEDSLFYNKPVICVAAAGGSGNGTLSCLSSLERFCMHVSSERFDFISITRKTREFKLEAIKKSSREMVVYKSNDQIK